MRIKGKGFKNALLIKEHDTDFVLVSDLMCEYSVVSDDRVVH